jgi:hypothetical protein
MWRVPARFRRSYTGRGDGRPPPVQVRGRDTSKRLRLFSVTNPVPRSCWARSQLNDAGTSSSAHDAARAARARRSRAARSDAYSGRCRRSPLQRARGRCRNRAASPGVRIQCRFFLRPLTNLPPRARQLDPFLPVRLGNNESTMISIRRADTGAGASRGGRTGIVGPTQQILEAEVRPKLSQPRQRAVVVTSPHVGAGHGPDAYVKLFQQELEPPGSEPVLVVRGFKACSENAACSGSVGLQPGFSPVCQRG